MKPDDILPELKQGGGETIDQGGQETKKIATSGKPKKEKLPDPEGDFVVAPCTEPKYFLKLQREELKANLELFSENEKAEMSPMSKVQSEQ